MTQKSALGTRKCSIVLLIECKGSFNFNKYIIIVFRGIPFIPFIDDLPSLDRKVDGPFMLPVVDKYKDMGTVVMGKVESGEAKKGQTLCLMPNKTQVIVDQLWSDDDEVTAVGPGENVKIKLKGVEEEEVSPGFILCDPATPCTVGRVFDAQVRLDKQFIFEFINYIKFFC